MGSMDIYSKIIELKKENRNFVTVAVVKSTGSTPGKAGFKMVVDHGGKTYGTVGGGAIEMEAIQESRKLMTSGGESLLKEYLLINDETIADPGTVKIPMSCNGKIWLYYEIEKNLPVIYVFGGGHVGQALIEILSKLKYHVVLIDNRQELFEKYKAKGINCIYLDYKEYVEQFTPADDSYFVVVTYGHQYDYDILKTLYSRKLVKKYIGIIASRAKSAAMINNLKNEIEAGTDLSKLHMPIGLKIGGDTAYEIALSIAAEIQSVRYEKKI
ncbi:MAG: XdhC family protein [Melioribacteraceae bacterium]